MATLHEYDNADWIGDAADQTDDVASATEVADAEGAVGAERRLDIIQQYVTLNLDESTDQDN
jgi:hypothetical protein